MSNQTYQNTLLENRSHLTARQSMQSLLKYAQHQDTKLANYKFRLAKANLFVTLLFITPPTLYGFYHLTIGYWRSIYPGPIITSVVDGVIKGKRQYFVPQLYLKDRQKIKFQVQLRQFNKAKLQKEAQE